MPDMTDPTAHRIEFEIDWPPWIGAAYLLDADEPVLVDAGSPGERGWTELREGLSTAGLEPADVAHLLVTHPHTDHDGQVARLVEAADPTVYSLADARDRMGMDESDLATRVRSNARAVGLDESEVTRYVKQAVSSLERNREFFPADCVDVALHDGDHVRVGGVEFEVIHTPGHQRDHACFALGDRLFAGDQVIQPFRAAALNVGLDDGVFDSIDEFYAAYETLSDRTFDRVYPGHGPVFSDYAGAVERSVESLDDLLAETASALADRGESTPVEVNEARVEEQRDYTLFETVGALGALETRGAAESQVREGRLRYSLLSANF